MDIINRRSQSKSDDYSNVSEKATKFEYIDIPLF